MKFSVWSVRFWSFQGLIWRGQLAYSTEDSVRSLTCNIHSYFLYGMTFLKPAYLRWSGTQGFCDYAHTLGLWACLMNCTCILDLGSDSCTPPLRGVPMERKMGYHCVPQWGGPGPSPSGCDQAWESRYLLQHGVPEPFPLWGLSKKWGTFRLRQDPAFTLVEPCRPQHGRPKNLWPETRFRLIWGNWEKTVNQAENVLYEEQKPATTPPNEVNLQYFSHQRVQTPTVEI